MQTRSQQADSQTLSSTEATSSSSSKAQRYQALYQKLKANTAIQKATEDAKQKKKREEKRLQKEQFAVQKQQLKSRCQNTSTLNFVGEFAESDEQVKTRLHSHLLTGRLQNKALQAFALEVSRRVKTDMKHQQEQHEDFRVSHKVFKRAAKKATELISIMPKSILKRRLSELNAQGANTNLQRQIRALKRSETKTKMFAEDEIPQRQNSPNQDPSAMAFEESNCHYMHAVLQHPERDMENKVPVIDQQQSTSAPVTPTKSATKPACAKKSSLPSLDLATRSMNKSAMSKSGRRLQFNDSVEVYFYPENKEQHDHHLQENDDDDLDEDEEVLRCEEPRLTDDDEERQEVTDPSFEELLFNYISQTLLPRIQQASPSSSDFATIGKRARRGRANSQSSPSVKGFAYSSEPDAEGGSDSDKSLSTNENSFPTTGISSAITSAEMGTSPTHQKTPSLRPKSRSYEVSKQEIHDVQGLTTTLALQNPSPQCLQQVLSASPAVQKQASKRQRLSPAVAEVERVYTPTKQSVRRCLFSEK